MRMLVVMVIIRLLFVLDFLQNVNGSQVLLHRQSLGLSLHLMSSVYIVWGFVVDLWNGPKHHWNTVILFVHAIWSTNLMGLNVRRKSSSLEFVVLIWDDVGLVSSLHLLHLSLSVHFQEVWLELFCLLLTRCLELFVELLFDKRILNLGLFKIELFLMINIINRILLMIRVCQLTEGMVFQVHLMAKIIVVL